VIPARCKSWACPRCAKARAKRLARRVLAWSGGKQLSLFTVTMAHDVPVECAWGEISACWNRWRTAYVKKYGRLRFVRILEPQPRSQYPHLHVLVDRYIDWDWNEQELERAGFGSIKDIARIDGPAAFHYVLKYLRKVWPEGPGAMTSLDLRQRRFSASRDCGPETAPLIRWERSKTKLSIDEVGDLLALILDAGGVVVSDGVGIEQSYHLNLSLVQAALRQDIGHMWYLPGMLDVAMTAYWAMGR